MKRVLAMNFITGFGSNMRLSVDDPREDLNPSEIKDFMELVIAKDIFNVEGGLESIKGATITSTEVDVIDLD